MRKATATIVVLVLCVVAFPFTYRLLQRLGGNHYPGTAQQSGAISLLSEGKRLALVLKMYSNEHGWPARLSDIVGFEGTTKEMLRYPRIYDMPDRRDLAGPRDFDEWIYLRPRQGSPDLPLLIAPLPYTSSMGRVLPKPKRIVVYQDTAAEIVEEEKMVPILRALSER